ncbi:ABC transporter substrate-binding protein, partial [Paenibacillus yanchengensis]
PFDSGVTGVYVRTDYLEQAGYTIEDLHNITWSKYIEIGTKVKEATGKHWISLDPNDLGIIRVMMQSAGAWYLKEDGVTPFIEENEALKEAFEVYKAMIDADLAKIHTDWSQYVANYNSGDVASLPIGNWFTSSIIQGEGQSGKWAIAPLPKLDKNANSVHASSLGGSSFYVLNTDGKEAAAEFLGKTLGSNVELYQELVTKIGAIGTYKPASEGEAYKAPNEFFQGQEIVKDFATWTAEIPKVNYGMHTYAIEDLAAAELQNYLNNKEIDKVLADLQKQADTQIR